MSRGLGKWERLLIHETYHDPRIAPNGTRYVRTGDLACTVSEYSAVQRASRSVVRKGLVRAPLGCANRLEPLPTPPPEATRPCPICTSVQKDTESRLSERLPGVTS